jgi:hypothetical protein
MRPVISELYRVFRPYRLDAHFTGCDHCVSQSNSEQLAAVPLYELTITDIKRYAFKAMTTWGTEHHYKHFLPRLLELVYEEYLAFDFPEVMLGKLATRNGIHGPHQDESQFATS